MPEFQRMSIDIKVVDSKDLLRQYIFLPQKIYRGDSRWVPPLYTDEWAFHNPRHNKALEYCDTIRVLALHNQEAVGRIMGIIHHRYNAHHQEKTVRFFNLDCINDAAVAGELIRWIERWGKEKGMTKIIGPFGFSDKDPQGLQLEGLHYLPVLATPTNPHYLQNLVERLGFEKEVDCVSYQMPVPTASPAVYERIYQRLRNNSNLRLLEFKSRRQLKPYILPVFRLVNEAYAHIFGFEPMSEEEMKKFADQYLPVLDPEFVKAVTDTQGNLVAFVVAMPDMSAGLQRAKGKLFPFGFLHILWAMRKTNQLNLLLGAIKAGYRNRGVSVMLGRALLASAVKRKLTIIDSHLILENNSTMRGECEKLNGRVCKRFRVYKKQLMI